MRITASKKYFWLMQVRAAFLVLIFSFFNGITAALDFYTSVLFGLVGLCFYAATALFYIHRYVNSVRVTFNGDIIAIYKGVLFQKKQFIPLESIRFVEIKKSPLSGLFGVFRVTVNTSSASVKIGGMDKTSADMIAKTAEVGAFEAV